MATEQEVKKWRASFANVLRDDQFLFSPAGKTYIKKMLDEGESLGFVDSDYKSKIGNFQTERLNYLRSQPLLNPQTGQPAVKQNAQGKIVPQTGADLFVRGQFVPGAGSQNVAAARQQEIGKLAGQTAADVQQLKGVADVLAPQDLGGQMRLLGAGVQGVMGGIGEGAKATNLLGIGSLSKMLGSGPMSAAQLQAGLQQRPVDELTAETALEDVSKPQRFGGFRFGQGVGGTLGGMVGSEVGGAAMTLSGIGKTAAAPFVMPLAAAASSFGGGAVANLISEGAMKGTYGEQGYKDVVRALQAAEQESPGIGMAADFGNVLLQGSPVLSSGVGARQVGGLFRKSVLGNAPSYIRGTAGQLGANAPRIADAIEAGVALPQAAASATKYDTFISNLLKKTGAASAEAIDRYATFTPTGGLGSRLRQFGQFARDTPGVQDLLADAIGEQAVNFGQAGADYYRELRESQETGGPPPDPVKALANLAFGSLFIGDNKATGLVGQRVRGIGSAALDVAGKIPGVSTGVDALKNRYIENLNTMYMQGRRADVLRGITSEGPTADELAAGTRTRIGAAPGGRPMATGTSIVEPDETPVSIGGGRVALWNAATGTSRVVPFGSVYGSIDDSGNVDDGKAIASGISGLQTISPARGINRLFPSGEQVLPTEGPAKQQVVGATDTGHVIIREVPVSAEGGRTQAPVYDIVRVEDLEEANKARGASVLEKAGIEASADMYQPIETATPGVSAFDQIAGFQQAILNIGSDITTTMNKEYQTEVQFAGMKLRGRIVGKEANGDIQLQLMTPGMAIVRVDPSNIIKGTTSVMEPMAISDLIDEAAMSDEARPTSTKKFDALSGEQDVFHFTGGDNVKLTAAQRAKIPGAVAAINAARADAASRSSDPDIIKRAVKAATDNQLRNIFGGGRVTPASARNDYEVGTPIQVNGPSGPETGLVIDNADAGPVVLLPSSPDEPVVIQEEDVVSGTAIARPEPEAAPTSTETTPAIPVRTEADIFSDNFFRDMGSFGGREKAMFVARQLNRRKREEDEGFPAPAPLERVFGFERGTDGKVVATDAQLSSRYNRMYNAMATHYNRASTSDADKAEIFDALAYLSDQYAKAQADGNRIQRRPRGTRPSAAAPAAATPAVAPAPITPEAMAAAAEAAAVGAPPTTSTEPENILDSLAAAPAIALNSLQARAIAGLVPAVDGLSLFGKRTVGGVERTYNIAQQIVRKRINGTNLTANEKKIADALEFPEYDGNEDWYRNAFQGVSYLNDDKVRKAVTEVIQWLDSDPSHKVKDALSTLSASSVEALKRGKFVDDAGLFDSRAIAIYGRSERGIIFGVLAQSAANTAAAPIDLPGQQIQGLGGQIQDYFGLGQVEFGTIRATDRASFTGALIGVMKKTRDAASKTQAQIDAEAKAITDMFDTFVHGATSRRIDLMIEAARAGYFSTRSTPGDGRTISATREGNVKRMEFTNSVAEDLRPLYVRLRSLLGLSANTDFARYYSNSANAVKIANAYAQLAEEESRRFYAERIPAFANINVLPDVAGINGALLNIYDPTQQTALSVIMAFKAADVSTFVHEIAHAYLEALPLPLQRDISSALGRTLRAPTITHPSVLSYEAQEQFAYGLEMTLSNQPEETWVGKRSGDKATKALQKVLKNVANAVKATYSVLVSNGSVRVNASGKKERDWEVPYTKDATSDPTGRVYLWYNAPVIFHDGTYGTVKQNFGTTKNGNREVTVEQNGAEFKVPNNAIRSIGGPITGLNPTVMQVMSMWVGYSRTPQSGKVTSTPEARQNSIMWNGSEVVSINRQGTLAPGEVTNANIDDLLSAIGITDVSDMQHDFIKQKIGNEELRRLINRLVDIRRKFGSRTAPLTQEQNDLRALTAAYAEARIRARLRDVANRGNATQQNRANAALNNASESTRTAAGAKYWAAVRALERVIHANRSVMETVAADLKKIAGSSRHNWKIKQENGRYAYNAQTGDITILKTERRGGKRTEVEYKVNLKTGVVQRPANVAAVIVPETMYYDDPQFVTRMPGGEISTINTEVDTALKAVGLDGAYTMRVAQPEYHIARALLAVKPTLIPDGLPVSPSVVFQTSGVRLNADNEVTIMAQLSREQQKTFVAPSLAVAPVPTGTALATMEEAESIGRADQAMQQTSGVKIVAQSPEVRQRQAKFVQNIIDRLTVDIDKKLDSARESYERKNEGKTPTLYAYEAYELREVYDVERGEPMTEMEITDSGEAIPKLRWDAKSMDYVPVIKTARVRTTIYSYEDLSKLDVPVKQSAGLYETDRHSSSTEASSKNFKRLEFGTDRPIWINIKGKEVPSKSKTKVVAAMVGNIEGRVRDVATRWTSEYNDALQGEAINPTEAWKPQEFDAEVKMRESNGITILAPSVKVRAQGYAIDTVEGNKGWNSLSTREVKTQLTVAQARKELLDQRKADGTENKHHAIAYPIEMDKNGKPARWGYSLMVRTTDVDPKTGTFQWKIENDWGPLTTGYASSKDAMREAQTEHDKLFGLAREKQEEEVSRHIAREVIEIIDAGRKALDKWNADNDYKFSAEEANAVNILRQFRWYKGMEERLKGTYGQFTTVMADVLGATSPQTPVWQNYAATLYLMQGAKGPHNRRVKLSMQTIARNPELLSYFPDESQQKKAMVVIKSDMRRTISVLKMHAIFVKALDKSFGTNPELTVDGLRDQIANRLSEVYERAGVDDTSGAEADLFVSLFEKDVPEAKRQEVLDQFNRYADKSQQSRMGGTVKKDTQFRSFVNEVEDWVSPKGEIAKFGGKTAQTTKVADLPKGMKLSLSETVVPRNLVTGSLYGSNSQNILMALTNEWLTVTEGMSAKARNFAMNFVGLSRGATIDVWAARLTRRHLNEVYMGVYTTRDGESRIEDPARYEAWEKLPEAERKQFFRMSPVQEQGVAGGYVTNLPKKVASNGYFSDSDRETDPVKFAPATREAVDVTNAEFIGEFGMANRVFDRTAQLINGYIGQENFMSPADLQAVVWFAEKERWVQNGWTTAAGAGGSFEQMYHEMMERAGAYERVSGTVYQPRMRLRGASAASLSTEEQKSLFDIATWPFLRNRRDSYQEGMGDLQREELVDGTNRHPVQSVQALAVTVSNDGMYIESAENANKTNLSVTYLTGAGREAEERIYSEPVPTVIIPEADADIMYKGMANASRTIYLPVENSNQVLAGLHNYAVGARTAFGIAGTSGPRLIGTGVIDAVAILDAADVPDDAPAKVKHESAKYVRIQLAETQAMSDSDVYLWNGSGRAEKMDARTNEYPWGQPLQAFDSMTSLQSAAERGVSENRVYVGQVPLEGIKNANGKKDKKNILPKPAGIPAAHPASRVMVIESTASLLSAMRDSSDVFMTTTRAVASEDDVYASYLDAPSTAVGKVPTGEAWKMTPPESNMRFGAYMLLRMPVGAERLIPGSRQAADNAHRRLMTSLRDSMPDVGYMVRIDADVRDWVSDITGNVGMPYVEIVFSPEEFIRNYNPITEVDGELPSNAAERSALFNAYVNGDVDAIRAAEERFAEAYDSWMNRVQNDPDLSAQVMLPGQTVYDLQVIPKERLKNAPSIREFAVAEAERQATTTRIADAVSQYAEAIGKTVDVETADEYYVSPDEPRVAQPDSVIEDWGDFREYTVMAQVGRPRVAEVTVSAYAGESRMGFHNIYNAALRDISNGAYAEAQRKFNVIADAAGVEIENAFGEMATSMSADITASVIAGDAKPAVTATIGVTADRLGTVIGRAAMIGKRLGQPNTFITEKVGRTKFGLEADGAMVVPSLTITLDEPLDSVGLRTLVDSAPAVFQGATQSADKRTLTVFMVPDTNIGTAEAREWTAQAQDLLNTFVQTYTTPADSYTNDALQRLSMEVAPGEGSPAHALVGDAFYDLPTDRQHQVNRDLTESAIREVESIMGVRLKSIVFGLGGWQHYQNASTVLQANLTPKQAEIAAHMLGYTLQQTAVWSNKITPFSNTSNAYAVDFVENGSKHLANSDKLSEVWAKLVEADDTSSNLDDKLFQGFQPIRAADGRTGIRVIIKSFSEGTGDQVERLLNGPIKDVVNSLDMELEVEGYSCVLIEAENDWKEKRNGESYLERLGDLLGPSAKSTIPKLDTARQKLEQQLKSAIESEPRKRQAVAAGRRRLWNLGSSELGGKGRFIEYETVRDIVSNVAPDDSLPSPEKVANTVNQAQRREIEEALSAVAGKRINLPKRVRFKRTPEHSIFQMHVGRHYENMPKNALRSDPHVKLAYDALVKELDQQFRSLNLSVDFMQPVLDKDGKQKYDASGDPMYIDPYTNADGKLDSTLAIRDVRENRHLYVYPTTEGTVGDAGDKADFEYLAKNHPLFQQSGFKTRAGQPMMWNDVLRAVHDALAHGTYGSSFSADGEETAFVAHAILTQDPWAIWALATETRMQNSWVHYGPHRVLADGTFVTTKPDGFASQKVGLSALECLYTGCSTVDDRLRVFSRKLRTEFNGYNGTVSYLSDRKGASVPNMGARTGAVEGQMKRKLYIMRGLPGSGKSTKAKELAGKLGKIFSTDDYFMQDGEYRFDAARLPENHRRNLDDSTMAMRRGTGTVVIDNTNIEPWHFEKYVEAGRLYGYEVEFVEFDPRNYSDSKIRELASRNTHRVPETAIRAMKDKWVAIDAKKYKDAKVMAMTGTDLPNAMSFGPTLLHNPKATDATIDLKNGTVEGFITEDAIDEAGHQSTFIPNPDAAQSDINSDIYKDPEDPTLMAQTSRIGAAAARGVAAAVNAMRPTPTVAPVSSVRTQPIKNSAARAVFVLNQILKAGAAGDASPVLMQNFPMALDKPDLFLRQLRLQAQVIFNPNVGWTGKDGKTKGKNLMYGRKLAQQVWNDEVRSKASYELAKKSGLSISAISNEKDLEDAKQRDPLVDLMDISELGHNSDVATEADFLQHLPGQGQSERFFMLSKDVVKMRQFDDMVQHLVDIGYNPSEWEVDEDGKLIETNWTRAVKDIAHILNVISGDVRIIEEDETDEAVMRIAKLLLFSPRWTASRLMVDRMGRSVLSFVAKSVPGGSDKVDQILRMNGMSPERLKARDPRIGALHARLLWKSWSMWIAVLAGIYAMRATNPRTMAVSIDKWGTRFKVGDFSFRMPGALMTQIEMLASVLEGYGEWEAAKGTVNDKPVASFVWDKVNQTLMSRASPIVSAGSEIITQRDTLGQPAFVTDEAIKVFHDEVIEPMGIKGLPSEWNKALTKRVMWWWVRDCMEMYQQQREFGVESSEALLSAVATGAYSAEGGRINYFPKALSAKIKAGQKMESQFDSPTDLITGGKPVIPTPDIYNPDKGPQPQDIRQPLFGGTGTDYMNPDVLRRTEPPRQ
jgi:predicted kinase